MRTDRSHIVLILGVVLGSTCLLAGCGTEAQRGVPPEQEQQPAAKNPPTPEPANRQDADPGDMARLPDETPPPPGEETTAGDVRPLRSESPLAPDKMAPDKMAPDKLVASSPACRP